MRDQITLACNDCKHRNYIKTKNKRLHPDRVEFKKYLDVVMQTLMQASQAQVDRVSFREKVVLAVVKHL